jgi:hypothetical protein
VHVGLERVLAVGRSLRCHLCPSRSWQKWANLRARVRRAAAPWRSRCPRRGTGRSWRACSMGKPRSVARVVKAWH